MTSGNVRAIGTIRAVDSKTMLTNMESRFNPPDQTLNNVTSIQKIKVPKLFGVESKSSFDITGNKHAMTARTSNQQISMNLMSPQNAQDVKRTN